MNITENTRKSFNAALVAVLTADSDSWPQPVIYADCKAAEICFGACNRPAMPEDAVVWMYVEPDAFGELSGCAQDDADGIEANMYDQAVLDIIENGYALHNENGEISRHLSESAAKAALIKASETGNHEWLTVYDWRRADSTSGEYYARLYTWDPVNGFEVGAA